MINASGEISVTLQTYLNLIQFSICFSFCILLYYYLFLFILCLTCCIYNVIVRFPCPWFACLSVRVWVKRVCSHMIHHHLLLLRSGHATINIGFGIDAQVTWHVAVTCWVDSPNTDGIDPGKLLLLLFPLAFRGKH